MTDALLLTSDLNENFPRDMREESVLSRDNFRMDWIRQEVLEKAGDVSCSG